MEEIEVPTDHLHDEIREKSAELQEKGEKGSYLYIAISTALMAVFAAMASLMAGHHSNEALIAQIKSSDQWAFYQAKSIKAEIRSLRPVSAQPPAKSPETEKKEAAEIAAKAAEFESESAGHLNRHISLARAVTFFQVAIAISAISIITRRTILWWVGIALSVAGLFFFITGLS
jgi:hypothetical protein